MWPAKVSMEVGEDGAAIMIINNPPVNSLSNSVFNDLYRRFEEVQCREDIKAVVITGANGKFSGGADIKGFQRKQNSEDEVEKLMSPRLTMINNIIEGCKKPVVAAIEGFALGGGLELAMACHGRIAVPTAQFGLPELQLGIIPGLGGTQRLPRLVGVKVAIDMLLTSRRISADEARKTGLVDDIVEPLTLLLVARRRALILWSEKCHQMTLHRMDKLGQLDNALKILKIARNSARKRFRNVKYPFLCLDAIEEGLRKGGAAGAIMENKISQDLVTTIEAQALMHFFFAQRSSFKVPGITDLGLQARPIRKVAIVGAGFMGSGIATLLIICKIPVILKDINAHHLQQGIGLIQGNLEVLVGKGKMTNLQATKSLACVTLTEDYTDFKDVDLVIESVIEDAALKQNIFRDLESACPPHCILASNTSSIDIQNLGGNISHPERVVGAHFFGPAHIMQLFEIVRTEWTSAQIIADLLAFAKTLQKVPLVVKSSLGFAANRIYIPYILTSFFLVDIGLDPYHIDAVIKEFGMPMGPFRVTDLTGIKTLQLVSQLWHEKYPGRFHQSALIDLLVKDNRLGNVTRSGFYNYKESGEDLRAFELKEYIKKSQGLAELVGVGKASFQHTLHIEDEQIIKMIFFPVINEACRILEEDIVTQPSALDIASILGMGFPAYRGGIIFWADNLGLSYILTQLKQWSKLYGNVYKPSLILERLVASKIPLGQFSLNSSRL